MPLGQHPLSVTEESLELPGQPYTARLCIDIASLRQHHARSAPYPHVDLTRLNTNASVPAKTVPHKTLSFTLRPPQPGTRERQEVSHCSQEVGAARGVRGPDPGPGAGGPVLRRALLRPTGRGKRRNRGPRPGAIASLDSFGSIPLTIRVDRHAFTTGGPPPCGDIMDTYKLSIQVSTEQG